MDEPAATVVDSGGRLRLVVDVADAGSRLDRLLGRLLAPGFSRSWLSALIDQGSITVDGSAVRNAYRVNPGQVVEGEIGRPAETLPGPEPMELSVIHEDDALDDVSERGDGGEQGPEIVELIVSDNGNGIPTVDQKNVFHQHPGPHVVRAVTRPLPAFLGSAAPQCR